MLVTSLSNFLTCSSIVAWCLFSSSSVNPSVVVRVRFPLLFHWMPAILNAVGAFAFMRYMLIVFRISNMSVFSSLLSALRWMMIVLSVRFAGPVSAVFFLLVTVAQVFFVFGASVLVVWGGGWVGPAAVGCFLPRGAGVLSRVGAVFWVAAGGAVGGSLFSCLFRAWRCCSILVLLCSNLPFWSFILAFATMMVFIVAAMLAISAVIFRIMTMRV